MASKAKEEKIEQEQPASKTKKINTGKIIKTTWKVIEKIIMVAIIIISLIIVTQRLTNNEKAFLGYRMFRVETGSMVPVYQIGDVILVKEKDTNKIEIGEDVTYWGTTGTMKGKIITHRVIDIEEVDGQRVFHTKGVTPHAKEDPVITGDQIDGVVQGKLYIITGIISLLNNKYIFYFLRNYPINNFYIL